MARDGRNGWTDFFQDLNPIDNTARYQMGAQSIDGYRLFMMIVGWALVAVISVFIWALMRSPWGRVLKSIREDEDAARALGKNVLGLQDAEPDPRRRHRVDRRTLDQSRRSSRRRPASSPPR